MGRRAGNAEFQTPDGSFFKKQRKDSFFSCSFLPKATGAFFFSRTAGPPLLNRDVDGIAVGGLCPVR
jgi:hypothetical protein